MELLTSKLFDGVESTLIDMQQAIDDIVTLDKNEFVIHQAQPVFNMF